MAVPEVSPETIAEGPQEEVSSLFSVEILSFDNPKRHEAEELVARQYHWLAAEGLTQEEVRRLIIEEDAFRHSPRAHLLAVTNPEGKVVGTVRIIIGGQDDLPPLDAAELMAGFDQWPHAQEGVPLTQIAELGRFAMAPHLDHLSKALAARELWASVRQLLHQHNIKKLYAIMPYWVIRFIREEVGMQAHRVEGVVSSGTQGQQQLARLFPGYWQKEPGLYLIQIDPSSEWEENLQRWQREELERRLLVQKVSENGPFILSSAELEARVCEVGNQRFFEVEREVFLPISKIVNVFPDSLREWLKTISPQLAQNKALLEQQLQQALAQEQPAWVFFPWNGQLIATLPPEKLRQVILERSLLSSEEQETVGKAKILLAGASTGAVIAEAAVRAGIGIGEEGRWTIADFDTLSLPNLSRAWGRGLGDLGEPKAWLTAYRLWEVFPTANITVLPHGIDLRDPSQLVALVGEHDIVIDAVDNPLVKLALRLAAKEAGVPLIMSTNLDRQGGVSDVEDYRRDRQLEPFHGRLRQEFGVITWDTIFRLAREGNRNKIGRIVFLGVGLETVGRRVLNGYLEYMRGKRAGIPQTAPAVGVTCSTGAMLIEKILLGEPVQPRTLLTPYSQLSPHFLEERLKDLRYALQVARQLGLPIENISATMREIEQLLG